MLRNPPSSLRFQSTSYCPPPIKITPRVTPGQLSIVHFTPVSPPGIIVYPCRQGEEVNLSSWGVPQCRPRLTRGSGRKWCQLRPPLLFWDFSECSKNNVESPYVEFA
ncbi:hypothetical protein NPIL_459161 [Nephila pilipes]|uniref:Uncharacterized protein n=1 Tax=Nephila pilipes TaxID=299642 RepID=A0A8X6U5K5_NEPPI|nr:hypothetical protein NPIL_459161 [Nephila pilipes]